MLKLRDLVKLHSKTASYVLSPQFEPKHLKELFIFMTVYIYIIKIIFNTLLTTTKCNKPLLFRYFGFFPYRFNKNRKHTVGLLN